MPNPLNARGSQANLVNIKPSQASNFAIRSLAPPVLVPSKYLGATQVMFSAGVQGALILAQRLLNVPTPNTTITSTITVTDQNNNPVSNLSALTLAVTFPDASVSSTMSLASGQITNLGSGQYQAKYTTKMAGIIAELWSATAADGVTVGQFRFEVYVGY